MLVFLLSEDSGKDSFEVVRALTKRMLRLIDGKAAIDRIQFAPLDNGRCRSVVKGNIWRSNRSQFEPALRDLIRTIVTELLRGFVFYHIDGDEKWSRRRHGSLAVFKSRVLDRVRTAVKAHAEKSSNVDAAEVLRRFRVLIPFYSIEAWLYQNTSVADQLCRKHHGAKCRSRIETWASDRRQLDELFKTKENLCLKSKHNRELAESPAFPGQAAFDANASFRSAVQSLKSSKPLIAELERLRPT